MGLATHMSGLSLLALVALLLRGSAAEEYTGYVVDNFCWNKDGHVGLDRAELGTAPETHWLHCLQVPVCQPDGFVMLEKLSSPNQDGFTYVAKYQLDDVGDALMIQLADAEVSRAGDRRLNEEVTVHGTLSGSEIAVTSLCLTPTVENPDQETFCFSQDADLAVPQQLAWGVVAVSLANFAAVAVRE